MENPFNARTAITNGSDGGGEVTTVTSDSTGKWSFIPIEPISIEPFEPYTAYPVTYPYTSNYPLTYPSTTTGNPFFNENTEREEELFAIPKCMECRKEVEVQKSYATDDMLVFIFECHNDTRRIDVPLERFKGNIDDAKEWLGKRLQWVFDEDTKWRVVKPSEDVDTYRADSEILKDWLEHKD